MSLEYEMRDIVKTRGERQRFAVVRGMRGAGFLISRFFFFFFNFHASLAQCRGCVIVKA